MMNSKFFEREIDIENFYEEESTDSPFYDFDKPEDVIFEVIEDDFPGMRPWEKSNMLIETIEPLIYDDLNWNDPHGAVLYENDHGMLDFMVMDLTEPPNEPGWYVLEGITAKYFKGEFGVSDDDMRFSATGKLRKATPEEIAHIS